MKIFLVGGCVRDELLGIKSKDRDFVVFDATEEEFLKRFPRAKKVGKKIPVYMVGRDEYTISEFKNIYEDLQSRDLTINAIAKDRKGNIYAHEKAIEDLKNRVLRAISYENFVADPLRVFRAARFSAEFPDFKVHDKLKEILRKVGGNRELLSKISKERVAVETQKAISARKPSNFFSLLIETNALGFWFEELKFLASKKRWLDLMDNFSGKKERVWLSLCYGFWENIKDKIEAKKHLLNMTKRIGMPNRYVTYGRYFFDYYEKAIDIFSKDASIIRDVVLTLKKKNMLDDFFSVLEIATGQRYLFHLNELAEKVTSIKLPEKYRGLGKKSSEILKKLQEKEIYKWLNSK